MLTRKCPRISPASFEEQVMYSSLKYLEVGLCTHQYSCLSRSPCIHCFWTVTFRALFLTTKLENCESLLFCIYVMNSLWVPDCLKSKDTRFNMSFWSNYSNFSSYPLQFEPVENNVTFSVFICTIIGVHLEEQSCLTASHVVNGCHMHHADVGSNWNTTALRCNFIIDFLVFEFCSLLRRTSILPFSYSFSFLYHSRSAPTELHCIWVVHSAFLSCLLRFLWLCSQCSIATYKIFWIGFLCGTFRKWNYSVLFTQQRNYWCSWIVHSVFFCTPPSTTTRSLSALGSTGYLTQPKFLLCVVE